MSAPYQWNPFTNNLDHTGAGGGGGSGYKWNVVTSADNPVILQSDNGYIAKGSSPVNFVLPAAAIPGNAYFIKGYGNLWTLAQNALQRVSVSASTSTTGVTGGLAATQVKDFVELLCVTADLEFDSIDSGGNITII
ncbi:MAG: hypothetical protein C5B43_01255 [Verrucomicrobia bacterium]|nr:MAG: hypothetical protein C5B43_01255 [Verrucomicrobiota bacterium]